MPYLSRITNTFFVNLINRLGVRPPPPEGFELSNIVQPVSIVDSDIILTAIASTQVLDTPFTGGVTIAGASTVLADTGAQAAGNYSVRVTIGLLNIAVAAVADFSIQRRNAADSVTVWEQALTLTPGTQSFFEATMIVRLLAGERLRVWSVGGSTSTLIANIWITQVT